MVFVSPPPKSKLKKIRSIGKTFKIKDADSNHRKLFLCPFMFSKDSYES